ncbi:MAG: hypothetical protein KDH96_02885 [Candidatus Riesia sp.]|nr:hypothetical protein [Candidatus Riesia sp.]
MIIFSSCLVGCIGNTKIVKPVPPPVVLRPILATSEITKETPNNEVVKVYRITIEQLIDYSKQLEMVIDQYREQSK